MTTDHDRIGYLAGEEPGDALDEVERRDLDHLRGLLSSPDVWADADPALEDAVVAAIAAEAAGRPVVASARAGRLSPGRSRWVLPAWLVGAAAAAVAVAVVATEVGSSDPPSEQLAAELDPTGLVPGAAGDATLTRTESGWRIEFDATGLRRLDDGRFYQAWLESDDGDLVPVGSFNEGRDVVLWAGVSPRDHRTITVTEEATDGDAASSGREVLVGRITDP